MKTIFLGGKHGSAAGRYALVSDQDYALVSKYNWYAAKYRKAFYARTNTVSNGERTMLSMHRLITAFKYSEVDHRNGNGLDNRRSNLRDGKNINPINQPARWGRSLFKGVTQKPYGWMARITVNKKRLYLGFFASEGDAARAYDAAARKYFGKAGRYNFPRRGERSAL